MTPSTTDLAFPAKVTITATGLGIPAGISREHWEQVGSVLGGVDMATIGQVLPEEKEKDRWLAELKQTRASLSALINAIDKAGR